MKKLLLTFLLSGLLLPSATRGGIERGEVASIFQEANIHYENGDYSRATTEYLRILEGGWESAPLYYNLGNAYFKQNRLGPAILQYRRALNLAPRDPEINKNLEYARGALKDDITALPVSAWNRAGKTVAGWLSRGEWIGISAALYGLALLWLLGTVIFRPLRKISPGVLKTILPTLFLSVALTLLAWSYYRTPRAIILEPEVAVRYGPQETDAAAFNLHEGTEVRVIRHQNGWRQVALPDGTSGWLPAESLGMI